ncbi:hypothetical protein [uncultured Thiodictyon sp.]|uniref:hypothetical protein n=1 Tax=uncultured Thiodictyon sp. TaxID=1846217 RepID=UPI0025CE2E4E|nr:hypothetical protein [uncultured Thiodictyon sp.]
MSPFERLSAALPASWRAALSSAALFGFSPQPDKDKRQITKVADISFLIFWLDIMDQRLYSSSERG